MSFLIGYQNTGRQKARWPILDIGQGWSLRAVRIVDALPLGALLIKTDPMHRAWGAVFHGSRGGWSKDEEGGFHTFHRGISTLDHSNFRQSSYHPSPLTASCAKSSDFLRQLHLVGESVFQMFREVVFLCCT